MSDKGETAHNGTAAPVKGRGGHCKRFWWIYALIFVIIAVLVPVLIIFVAIPKIAQKKIDEAQLTVQGIRVTNTQSQSYTMDINSTITTDGKVHATIDSFKGVMYIEDLPAHTPFVTIDFPQTDSSALQVVNTTQAVTITDMAAFTQFNTWLVTNKTLKVTVEGDTQVHLKGLSRAYGVHFKKTIEMPGLDGFAGTTVSNASIVLDPRNSTDGNNFHGTATIPNKSLVTFEIGNATFFNYLGDQDIGTVYINNMILAPGNNSYPMAANISQAPVVNAYFKKPYCETGVIPFGLRGKTVVNNGQNLTYFADALSSYNQTVEINLVSALAAIGLKQRCT